MTQKAENHTTCLSTEQTFWSLLGTQTSNFPTEFTCPSQEPTPELPPHPSSSDLPRLASIHLSRPERPESPLTSPAFLLTHHPVLPHNGILPGAPTPTRGPVWHHLHQPLWYLPAHASFPSIWLAEDHPTPPNTFKRDLGDLQLLSGGLNFSCALRGLHRHFLSL